MLVLRAATVAVTPFMVELKAVLKAKLTPVVGVGVGVGVGVAVVPGSIFSTLVSETKSTVIPEDVFVITGK